MQTIKELNQELEEKVDLYNETHKYFHASFYKSITLRLVGLTHVAYEPHGSDW